MTGRAARAVLSVVVALIAGWVAGAVGFGVWCWVKARKHWGHLDIPLLGRPR